MDSAEADFDDVVRAVVDDFGHSPHATPCLDDEAFSKHARAVDALTGERRHRVAIELVALCRRVVDNDDPAWSVVSAQLCWLAGVALRTLGPLDDEDVLQGLDNERALALIGEARHARPVTAGISFETSLLGVQVAAKGEKNR